MNKTEFNLRVTQTAFLLTPLKTILIHRGRKSLNRLPLRCAFHARANMRFPLRAGLSQDRHGTEGFGIDPRNQVDIPRSVLFPKLANLNFRYTHKADIECRVLPTTCQPGPRTMLVQNDADT